MTTFVRPARGECADYYFSYIDGVPDGDVLEVLAEQIETTASLLRGVDEATASSRYAPGKWTVKEVVGHVIDAEWVFALRALVFARGDDQRWPGMEQDDFARNANYDRRPLPDIVDELFRLRAATLGLFRTFDEEIASRRGVASDVEFTVRSIPWILAGHERHHVRVLRERYL